MNIERGERYEDLYGLPYVLDPPDRLRYFDRRGNGRRRRASPEFLLVVRVPTVGAYDEQVRRIIAFVWSHLPQEWKDSSKLQLRFSFHPDHPGLEYSEEDNAKVLRYSTNTGSREDPEFVLAESEIAARTYDFHGSTQLYVQGLQS